METKNDLLLNLEKIHTTQLGVERIKKNLCLDCDDVVVWCVEKIALPDCKIERHGKNWYAQIENCVITVNAYSFTIITAHQIKHKK